MAFCGRGSRISQVWAGLSGERVYMAHSTIEASLRKIFTAKKDATITDVLSRF